MAKLGRKTKLTPATVRDLCAALSIGSPWEVACAYARVSRSMVFRWRQEAVLIIERIEKDSTIDLNEKERRLLDFYNKVEDSMADAAIGWQQVIDRAATHDPGWAKFMLKVRYPDGYREAPQAVDITTGGRTLDEAMESALLKVYGEAELEEEEDENSTTD